MSLSTSRNQPWSKWHARLHKSLKAKPDLLPSGACLLIAVSGGQDSMALLKLMIDLNRIYNWNLNVWHGDHGWHEDSNKIANELKSWCSMAGITFYRDTTNRDEAKNEASAREWRYKNLKEKSKLLIHDNEDINRYIITGHTSSDRAETILLNLARGTDLAGLSALTQSRGLESNIKLIRPILGFSREDTSEICKAMRLPIWLDPSNENTDLKRNFIRLKVLPKMEEMHPGCSKRIAALAERLGHHKDDQNSLAKLALKAVKTPNGLCRKSVAKLPATARGTLLAYWLKDEGVPMPSANILEELSLSIGPGNPPGSRDLSESWKVSWISHSVQISKEP